MAGDHHVGEGYGPDRAERSEGHTEDIEHRPATSSVQSSLSHVRRRREGSREGDESRDRYEEQRCEREANQ